MRWRILLCAAVLLAAVPARASHDDGRYDQPSFGVPWDTARLQILIVPPTHGQLLNANGALAGMQTSELDPLRNSYLAAIEDSIDTWRDAIRAYAPTWLRRNVRLDDYVVGRDEIPDSAQRDPEIVINTTLHQGTSLGLTVQGPLAGVRCTISNARMFIESFTYADMFSVNAHEVGHCLGLDHIGGDHPRHDVMASIYPHEPGSAGTHLHCPSNLNVRGIKRSFAALFGKPARDSVSIPADRYTRLRC